MGPFSLHIGAVNPTAPAPAQQLVLNTLPADSSTSAVSVSSAYADSYTSADSYSFTCSDSYAYAADPPSNACSYGLSGFALRVFRLFSFGALPTVLRQSFLSFEKAIVRMLQSAKQMPYKQKKKHCKKTWRCQVAKVHF